MKGRFNMENNNKLRLTLDQQVRYQIQVPGHMDESWLDWVGELAVETGCDDTGSPVTTLSGTFDQAALIGLLRRLYSLGLPLISVNYLEIV
jgi:hypothetical protein